MEAKYPKLVSGAKHIGYYDAEGHFSQSYVYLAQCIDGEYCSDKWDAFREFATKACNEYADLVNALESVLVRMERARNILTNGNPTRENNWGMLDTTFEREVLKKAGVK